MRRHEGRMWGPEEGQPTAGIEQGVIPNSICKGFSPPPAFFRPPARILPCQGPAIQGSVILFVHSCLGTRDTSTALGMRLCSAMPSVVAAKPVKPVKPVIIFGLGVESSPVLVLTCMGIRYNNSFDRHVTGDLRWAESRSRLAKRKMNPGTRDWRGRRQRCIRILG